MIYLKEMVFFHRERISVPMVVDDIFFVAGFWRDHPNSKFIIIYHH